MLIEIKYQTYMYEMATIFSLPNELLQVIFFESEVVNKMPKFPLVCR